MESTTAPLTAATFVIRDDLSVMLQVGDCALEVHLSPNQALELGAELINRGLAAKGLSVDPATDQLTTGEI